MRSAAGGRHLARQSRGRVVAVLVWLVLGGLAGLVTWTWVGAAVEQHLPAPTPAPATAQRAAASSPPTAPAASSPAAPDPASSPAASSPVSAHWSKVLAELDRRRELAFSTERPALLAGVYAPRSTVLSHDRVTMAAYRARGLRLLGLRLLVRWVRVLDEQPRRAVLVVRDQLDRVVAVDSSGRRMELPHDLPTTHRITVVRTPNGWRIAAIS